MPRLLRAAAMVPLVCVPWLDQSLDQGNLQEVLLPSTRSDLGTQPKVFSVVVDIVFCQWQQQQQGAFVLVREQQTGLTGISVVAAGVAILKAAT